MHVIQQKFTIMFILIYWSEAFAKKIIFKRAVNLESEPKARMREENTLTRKFNFIIVKFMIKEIKKIFMFDNKSKIKFQYLILKENIL